MRRQIAMLVLAVSVGACASESSRPLPSGEQTFVTHCASCHGPQGEGDGPAAGIMRVTVPNLRTLRARNEGVFPAESVAAFVDGRNLPASHGDRYMPIWGDVFEATERLVRGADAPERRIRAVVDFVLELQYP